MSWEPFEIYAYRDEHAKKLKRILRFKMKKQVASYFSDLYIYSVWIVNYSSSFVNCLAKLLDFSHNLTWNFLSQSKFVTYNYKDFILSINVDVDAILFTPSVDIFIILLIEIFYSFEVLNIRKYESPYHSHPKLLTQSKKFGLQFEIEFPNSVYFFENFRCVNFLIKNIELL